MTKSSLSIWHLLSKRQINSEDFIIFCGLLGRHELYIINILFLLRCNFDNWDKRVLWSSLKEVPAISTTLFASVCEKFVNSLQFLGDAPLTMAGIAEFSPKICTTNEEVLGVKTDRDQNQISHIALPRNSLLCPINWGLKSQWK